MSAFARRLLAVLLALPCIASAAMAVSSSSSHSLAVKTDGTVVAWGSDREGALGSGRVLDSTLPVKVPGLPRIATFVARANMVVAIDGDGRAWTWGEGSAPLGPREGADPGIPSRIRGLANVVGVAIGSLGASAVRRDGTVVCWGRCQANTTPVPGAPGLATIDGLADIVAIAQGQTQLLALRRDGTVLSVGDNFYGDVGDGTRGIARPTPYLIPGLANIVRIDATIGRSLALRSDGTVFLWGSNLSGAPAAFNAPQALAGLGGPAIAIFAGGPGLAVRNDGTVWSFQDAGPTQVAGFTAARAAASLGDSILALGADGLLRGKGPNDFGQLGNGTTAFASAPGPVSGLVGVTRVDGQGRSFAALTALGEVWTWGGNGNLLGNGDPQDRAQPFAVPGLANIVAVAAGQDSSYAVTAGGQVYSWGSNVGGKLGRPGITRSATPALVPGLTGVVQVAAGAFHVLYLKSTGALFHSGRTRANPGDTCTGACATIDAFNGLPIQGVRTDIPSIAAGVDTSYFISVSGSLWAWGANALGQLGVGNTTDQSFVTLVQVGGRAVKRVSTQRATVLAIVDDAGTDRVMAWGDNVTNQTGRSFAAPGYFTTPGFVASTTTNNAKDIAAGHFHSLVLRADGQVLAFGNNARGELGDGTTANSVFARPVLDLGPQGDALAGIASLSAGEARSFALRGDGLVYAWGAPNGSGYGNLADGTFVRRTRPVVAVSEKPTANLDDTACSNSPADTFWYLDLDPAACVAVPAAKVLGVLPIALQSTSSGATSLSAQLGVRRIHQGQVKKTFVVGAVPSTFLDVVPLAPGQAARVAEAKARAKATGPVIVQLTSAGWSVVAGPFSALVEGVSAAVRQQLQILEAVPPDKIPGAQFCVGYGDSAEEMLASGQLRVVATIPGTDLTVPLPCLLSGTYIDGPAASLQGSPVAFRAVVVGENPTGTVQFKDGAANLGGANTLVATSPAFGTAQASTAALAAGDHAITAAYSGDSNPVNAASASGPLAHRVVAAKSASATSIGGESRSLLGTATAFEASVAGANPSGFVTFRDGATSLGTYALSGGIARATVTGLAAGPHSITAEYAGDGANFASASTPLSHTVYAATGQAAVTLAGPPDNRATAGQAAAFTVTVTGNAPTGLVELVDGFTVLASGPLGPGGSVVLDATFAGPGLRLVFARYAGDAGNAGAGSASLALDVLPAAGLAPSTTLLAADANPSTLGQAVTFTATVSGASGAATGTVAFRDGAATIAGCGAVALANGLATCATNALGAGSHGVTATYGGNATYGTSTSATLAQVVNAGAALLAPATPALDFGGQSMRTASPTQTVGFTNTTGAALTVSSVGVPAGFVLATNGCATLAAGATCTVGVAFLPQAEGAAQGLLTLTYAGGGPTAVALSGVGEKSLVTHYYRAVLRRAPDASGKAFWESEATRMQAAGANLNETWFAMAQSFYASPEYAAFARDAAGFVTDLYNTFFNRGPDGAGLAFWTGQLAQGMPREVVLASFMFSAEFGTFTQAIFGNTQVRREIDTVTDFYRGLLGRLPDAGGFGHWVQQFRTAQCQGAAAVTAQAETISSGFATSGEYAGRARSNAQYVGDLYNAFLRRGGELGGVQFWIDAIAGGQLTREQVRQQFVASAEFQARVQAIIAQGCLP